MLVPNWKMNEILEIFVPNWKMNEILKIFVPNWTMPKMLFQIRKKKNYGDFSDVSANLWKGFLDRTQLYEFLPVSVVVSMEIYWSLYF